jgi:hypothetical protein
VPFHWLRSYALGIPFALGPGCNVRATGAPSADRYQTQVLVRCQAALYVAPRRLQLQGPSCNVGAGSFAVDFAAPDARYKAPFWDSIPNLLLARCQRLPPDEQVLTSVQNKGGVFLRGYHGGRRRAETSVLPLRQ